MNLPRATHPEAVAYWKQIDEAAARVAGMTQRQDMIRDDVKLTGVQAEALQDLLLCAREAMISIREPGKVHLDYTTALRIARMETRLDFLENRLMDHLATSRLVPVRKDS